jgi:hypothetical protein
MVKKLDFGLPLIKVKFIRKKDLKDFCKVKIYHKNGKIRERGQTKTNENDNTMHWFYDGAWKIYDENGKHIFTKIYKQGTPLIVFLQSKILHYFLDLNGFSLVITNPLR